VSWLSKVFEINPKGLNVKAALVILVVLGLPLIVMEALGWSVYWVNLAIAGLFVGLSDPGGEFRDRARRMGEFALIGAVLTALAYAIGDKAWELVVLAVFVVTLLSGLAIKFGPRRFAAGFLLNCWFVIAIGLPAAYVVNGDTSHTWGQVLAWLAGSALWIAFAWIMWLASGRGSRPAPVPGIPGDTSAQKLTKPIISFMVIRALAVSLATGIAFGLALHNAYWMPYATLISMKSNLEQSALRAEQRLIGAIIGAVIASLCILTINGTYALDVLIIVLGAIGGSVRGLNYTLYTAAIAGCVLISSAVSHHTSSLSTELQRVLYTLAGVGIAVIVMLLVTQLQKRAAKPASPQPA
jgi:hypothetical protein